MIREGAENDLVVRQCTFAHAAAYCHTQRCPFGAQICSHQIPVQ